MGFWVFLENVGPFVMVDVVGLRRWRLYPIEIACSEKLKDCCSCSKLQVLSESHTISIYPGLEGLGFRASGLGFRA